MNEPTIEEVIMYTARCRYCGQTKSPYSNQIYYKTQEDALEWLEEHEDNCSHRKPACVNCVESEKESFSMDGYKCEKKGMRHLSELSYCDQYVHIPLEQQEK